MAKHEIIIHENTSATKESAPYLGSYLSKETIKSDEFAAKNLFGNALDCTFDVSKGITEIDAEYAKTHTTLTKSLTDATGGPECTLIDPGMDGLMISFGEHDAQVGDKRYVHFGYAEGKTVVLPVTVTEEE